MTPYLGQIILFAGDFAPEGWAFCHGQVHMITQNTDLFNLIRNTYGGDGTNTFALPDMRGRIPVGSGTPDPAKHRLNAPLGSAGGRNEVQLTEENLPPHQHNAALAEDLELKTRLKPNPLVIATTDAPATSPDPGGNILAMTSPSNFHLYAPPNTDIGHLGGLTGGLKVGAEVRGGVSINSAGGSSTGKATPVPTLPPYLGINYIIATSGIYPQANR